MTYEAYYQHYEERGLFFDRALLTTYCLSLHAKPFVILSGISGTGKTKIAQLFNVPAANAVPRDPPRAPAVPPSGNWIIMTVTDGVTTGDGRANFRYSDLGALLDPAEVAALQPRIEQLSRSGADDNICPPFSFTIDAPDGTSLEAKAYLQRARSPLLRIRFKSKRGEPPYDSTSYFARHYPVGTVLKLEKVGDKHLRIASVNDQAVVQLSQELEDAEAAQVENSCFIPVRSDWTDSTPIFGYYNLIDQRYHVTPALTFILKAKENPKIPFFLILDEMNLAKVEHYFSDFLSCLESRRMEGGRMVQEPVHLHSNSGWIDTNNEYFDVIAPTLELPSNLFVTGTVNIDESTYVFSPKVLDRANVIELNEVDVRAYAGVVASPAATFLLERFPDFSSTSLPAKVDFNALPLPAKTFVTEVHSILARHHLHFGYRVINEISKYVLSAQIACVDHPELINEALDWQLIQKVLPKLNGSQAKLDVPIRELLTFLVNGSAGPAMEFDAVNSLDPHVTKYPRSVAKLKRMSHTLMLNGFANFIE